MSLYSYYTLLLSFPLLFNFAWCTPECDAKSDARISSYNEPAFSTASIARRLVGIWDLLRVDNKPSTGIFTTEFRNDGTYSVTTSQCKNEEGIWKATQNTIIAKVTHSPTCKKNVGSRFSDEFVLFGQFLNVYIFDKNHVKHKYTFKKRTLFYKA